MKKDNKNILIYSSAIKAISHLDKVDIHPGSDQRNIDAAYQRLEDIRDISLIVVDKSINEQVAKKKKSNKLKIFGKINDPAKNQGRRKEQIEATETAAIISVLFCILIIVLLAFLR